jgi:hypothetical protein
MQIGTFVGIVHGFIVDTNYGWVVIKGLPAWMCEGLAEGALGSIWVSIDT